MADIKYAVYKIFNGKDFDTIYFKAPAKAITESDDKQFISKDDKALITSYLNTFNEASKLVKLGTDGKIPKGLINEDFGNYLDKRPNSGIQAVSSRVVFDHEHGIFAQKGISLSPETAQTENISFIDAITGDIKLSVGLNQSTNQEITFTKDGKLNFKKKTIINNVEIGDDDSAVPKRYVDTVIETGAKPIESVIAATAIFYATMPSGLITPDGVPVKAGDRVLLKDQEDKTKNGIYEVSTGSWTRVNEDSNLKGALVFVKEGKVNNDSKWFHKGGGEWIRFSQTDQLQFTGGLVRSDDTVSLLDGAIINKHIKSDAGIELSKLATHTGSPLGWDVDTMKAVSIQTPRSVGDRLEDLAMTIERIRGTVGTTGHYGEWNVNSLTMSGLKDALDKKQNPVAYGTADPTASLFTKGDVYLHTDS